MYLHLNEIYQNKAWVLVDGDKAGTEVLEKLRKRYTKWEPNRLLSLEKPYIELYYPEIFTNEINTIMEQKNGFQKQYAKTQLLNKVIEWIWTDPLLAQKHFRRSASEIIDKLISIDRSLFEI